MRTKEMERKMIKDEIYFLSIKLPGYLGLFYFPLGFIAVMINNSGFGFSQALVIWVFVCYSILVFNKIFRRKKKCQEI